MGILKKFLDYMRLPKEPDDEYDCNHEFFDDDFDDEFFDDDSDDDYIDICNDCDYAPDAKILSAMMKDNEIIGISVINPDGHSKLLLCGQHNSSVLKQKACNLSTTKNPKSAT